MKFKLFHFYYLIIFLIYYYNFIRLYEEKNSFAIELVELKTSSTDNNKLEDEFNKLKNKYKK